MDTVIARQIIEDRNSTDYIDYQKMALVTAYRERNTYTIQDTWYVQAILTNKYTGC